MAGAVGNPGESGEPGEEGLPGLAGIPGYDVSSIVNRRLNFNPYLFRALPFHRVFVVLKVSVAQLDFLVLLGRWLL